MINLTINLKSSMNMRLVDVGAIEKRWQEEIGPYLYFTSCGGNQFDKVPTGIIKAIYFTSPKPRLKRLGEL